LEDIRVDEKLSELQIIDLFPNWQQGIQRILKSIGVEQQGPNDFWGLMTEGNVLMDSGKYDEALGYYNKALNIDPKNSYAWYNKGMALCLLGKYKEAMEYYDKAIEIDPDNGMTWYAKGDLYHELKQGKEKADQCFAKARGLGFKPPS
jgi:tetratricopeptide (TPR) repeat protein